MPRPPRKINVPFFVLQKRLSFAFHFGREILYKVAVSNPPHPLQTPLRELRGIGPERAGQLERLELRCVGDLLLHRPRRYEDRRHFLPIASLKLEEPALARGKILAAGELTLDHVIPRSRGGASTWENLVACCHTCNRRKGNLLPHESSMKLMREPRAFNLHTSRHIMRMMGRSDSKWQKYLFY